MREKLESLLRETGYPESVPEHMAKRFFSEAGIRVPEGVYIKRGEGLKVPEKLRFPLAAKVVSLKLRAKSEIGGVRLGIKNEKELDQAVCALMGIPEAEGVLVEEMAPEGVETIVGGIMDPQFGPVVMFGLGGIFVEVYGDVAFALAPATKKEALWLIEQVKGHKILQGIRGRPPADMDALAGAVVKVSEVIAAGLLDEVDLNPLVVYPEGAIAVDAKIFPKRDG